MITDHNDHNHESRDNIKVAFFLNFGFTILEVVGGFWTNSVAILTDAIHDLGDSISLVVSALQVTHTAIVDIVCLEVS